MILKYKISVMPFGSEHTLEAAKINTLTFELQFTEDLDNFIKTWLNSYPKAAIRIEASKK